MHKSCVNKQQEIRKKFIFINIFFKWNQKRAKNTLYLITEITSCQLPSFNKFIFYFS